MQKITDNVFVGTNICNHSFVKTKDGIVMIDTPAVPAAALAWRKEIAAQGRVRYLINTEPHLDHFGGDYFFDAPAIVAQSGARAAMAGTPVEFYTGMIGSMTGEEVALPEGFAFPLPTITFGDSLTLCVGDHAFQLFHLPGHTPFQAVVYVPEERVVFTGDNVVNKAMPFFHQAVPFEWLKTLDRLMELDVETVIPGHGVIGDKSCIPRMKEEVQVWIETVKAAIGRGMTSEEAQANLSFLDRYPDPNADDAKRTFFQRNSIAHLYEVLKGG